MKALIEAIMNFVGLNAKCNLSLIYKIYVNILNNPYENNIPDFDDFYMITNDIYHQWCNSESCLGFEQFMFYKTSKYSFDRPVNPNFYRTDCRFIVEDFEDFEYDLYQFETVFCSDYFHQSISGAVTLREPSPEEVLEIGILDVKKKNHKTRLDRLFSELISES